MNLELIQEIDSLKENNLSYTEIAERTGVARTSVVLSLRLSKIFNSSYAQKISSFNSEIELLKSTVDNYNNSFLEKEAEIQSLKSFVDIDYNCDMLIRKSEFKDLKNELVVSKKEVDILSRKLRYQSTYLKNLSLTDKMKSLFN
ncbi:MAG: hypothetical protein KGZ62_03690 [Sulfurimonas sp.]|nr:hypothetical protein [Sulfurimonas sp.]